MALKNKIAIMYDFDKTLSPKDMQEFTFMPKVDQTPEQFWTFSNSLARDKKMDGILAYLYAMVKVARDKSVAISRKDFHILGDGVEFFPGVVDWFGRINEHGKEQGFEIEHYIISSGLKEIIEGTSIYEEFKEVYACEFLYDEYGKPVWPALAVNYTGKTQFIFRINKGVLDITNDKDLNKATPKGERDVPFNKMIYIGDGLTDVPCMRLVREYGGQSIAVFRSDSQDSVQIANQLLMEGRVDFTCPADYSDGQPLDTLMKKIINRMALSHQLASEHQLQINELKKEPDPTQQEDTKPKVINFGYCPSCHSKLVKRMNHNSGEEFLGCSNFPNCYYSQAIYQE